MQLRKRTLMASKEAGEPTIQKKQKALTIQEPPVSLFDIPLEFALTSRKFFVLIILFFLSACR
jgi:hypothetical protein